MAKQTNGKKTSPQLAAVRTRKKQPPPRGLRVKVIIHEAEEGGFWAEVPALPGCFTQAETRAELLVKLREAVEGCLLAGSGTPPVEEGGIEEEIEL